MHYMSLFYLLSLISCKVALKDVSRCCIFVINRLDYHFLSIVVKQLHRFQCFASVPLGSSRAPPQLA
jgi:hypothetical protein